MRVFLFVPMLLCVSSLIESKKVARNMKIVKICRKYVPRKMRPEHNLEKEITRKNL